MLKEAKRLYDLGFAVHWIKPGSKAPVKSGWSSPTRDRWAVVEREYKKGYGLGVRMGESSKLKDGTFLANIDVDLKGATKRDRREALAVVEERFPGVVAAAPCVFTDHGLRYFVRTRTPVPSGKISASPRVVKVLLPTTEVNRRQHQAVAEGILTEAELADGYRVRNAWEVELMSVGKQVVLPPSIHPDTRKPYAWVAWAVQTIDEMPLIVADKVDVTRGKGRPAGVSTMQGWTPAAAVDLAKLSPKWRDALVTGDGVTDRSSACFSVAMAMLKSGYKDDDVLTVLTEPTYYLGETGYDHRHTKSRKAAAAWVRDYCLRKAKDEVDAAKAFSAEVGVTPTLSKEKAAKQAAELTHRDWTLDLQYTKEGALKPTLQNTVAIFENAVSPELIKRDTFAGRDFYGVDPPWEGKKDDSITDDDAVKMKHWLAEKWGYEPTVNTIFEAVTYIATRNAFNPVKDELEALPEWDGVERIDTWLGLHFGAVGHPEYLAQVFRKWLVGSVARTYNPGHKFDWLPIFQGNQGTGKSSFGAILFGQRYFADWLPDLGDKDAALGLMGKRCIEFGELDSLRRNELETIKAFVTRQVDNVRPPYGRKSLEIYRGVVFFGSTNKDYYLIDDTGNRRFNPIKVGPLNFKALARDRDQLWAEALCIWRNGFESSLYLEGAAAEFANVTREEKRVIDEPALMADAFATFLHAEAKKPEEDRFDLSRFRLVSLFSEMGPLSKWKGDARDVQYAAKALKRIKLGKKVLSFSNRKSDGHMIWELTK